MVSYLIFIVLFIFSITVHEFFHGYVADQLGDPTPRLSKRLTLNPIPHIDLFGTIIIPFVLQLPFGWAKPMPIDPYNLRNPKKDTALIAFAGPCANLIVAIILSIVLRLLNLMDINYLITISSSIILTLIKLNVTLAFFNLLPIHPLDGFSLVAGFLSEEKYEEWIQLKRYGMFFLLILIFPIFGGSSMIGFIMNPVVSFIYRLLIPYPFNLTSPGII